LKAFGARSVTVFTSESGEPYLDFVRPRKFDGLLPKLWEERGVLIYDIPHSSPSLASVVPRTALVTQMPENGIDTRQLERYVAALENPDQRTTWQWHGTAFGAADALVPPGTVLSIPISYHPGWRAQVAGREVPVESDGLGHIVLDPACNGPCTVELTFTGGREWLWSRLASALTLLALAAWAIVHRRYDTLNLQDRKR
jgi:hypothetical protein